MIKKVLLVSVVFLGLLGSVSAQTRSLTVDEMFQLADQHNKSIRLYDLAISEAEQAVKVACNDRLPSIQAQMDFKYIGDGVMTDRNFSNAVHADMPHFGNSFVVKASQVVYAGGAITKGIERVHPDYGRILRCRTTSCYTSPWNPQAYTELPSPASRTGVHGIHLSPQCRGNLLPYGSKENKKSW